MLTLPNLFQDRFCPNLHYCCYLRGWVPKISRKACALYRSQHIPVEVFVEGHGERQMVPAAA